MASCAETDSFHGAALGGEPCARRCRRKDSIHRAGRGRLGNSDAGPAGDSSVEHDMVQLRAKIGSGVRCSEQNWIRDGGPRRRRSFLRYRPTVGFIWLPWTGVQCADLLWLMLRTGGKFSLASVTDSSHHSHSAGRGSVEHCGCLLSAPATTVHSAVERQYSTVAWSIAGADRLLCGFECQKAFANQ